jgi:hypothetical protein
MYFGRVAATAATRPFTCWLHQKWYEAATAPRMIRLQGNGWGRARRAVRDNTATTLRHGRDAGRWCPFQRVFCGRCVIVSVQHRLGSMKKPGERSLGRGVMGSALRWGVAAGGW